MDQSRKSKPALISWNVSRARFRPTKMNCNYVYRRFHRVPVGSGGAARRALVLLMLTIGLRDCP